MKNNKNIVFCDVIENICTYIVVCLGLVFSRLCLNTDKMLYLQQRGRNKRNGLRERSDILS